MATTLTQPAQPTSPEEKLRLLHEAFMNTIEGTPEYEQALDELLQAISPPPYASNRT